MNLRQQHATGCAWVGGALTLTISTENQFVFGGQGSICPNGLDLDACLKTRRTTRAREARAKSGVGAATAAGGLGSGVGGVPGAQRPEWDEVVEAIAHAVVGARDTRRDKCSVF